MAAVAGALRARVAGARRPAQRSSCTLWRSAASAPGWSDCARASKSELRALAASARPSATLPGALPLPRCSSRLLLAPAQEGRRSALRRADFGHRSHGRVSFFEERLDFWRQLWRVLERSDVAVMIVDARNPLLHFSEALVRPQDTASIQSIRRDRAKTRGEGLRAVARHEPRGRGSRQARASYLPTPTCARSPVPPGAPRAARPRHARAAGPQQVRPGAARRRGGLGRLVRGPLSGAAGAAAQRRRANAPCLEAAHGPPAVAVQGCCLLCPARLVCVLCVPNACEPAGPSWCPR
jgi:hypothetical protein